MDQREIMTMNVIDKKNINFNPSPSREEAMQAVKTLIAWAGDNPDREGLVETPKRVVDAYKEFFAGYNMNPDEILSKTFEEVEGYDEMVLIKNIKLESHCEHHIVPILGVAHVAYMPNKRVVGISKLARLVDVFAKRLTNTGNSNCSNCRNYSKCPRPVRCRSSY